MNDNLDSVMVELVVTACQMSEDNIWMQGDLKISFNGEKPYSDSDIVDVEAFLKSLEQDGEYAIFSCNCGIPACSGWVKGIQVLHSEETIVWTNLNNGKTWCFDKQKVKGDLVEVRKEVEIYKQFFNEKGIEYVGVGYTW